MKAYRGLAAALLALLLGIGIAACEGEDPAEEAGEAAEEAGEAAGEAAEEAGERMQGD